MTDEQLAEIRARIKEMRSGPEFASEWEVDVIDIENGGRVAIVDRSRLLAEVDRLRAIGRRIVAALEPCEGAGVSAWYHNGEPHGESIEGLYAELKALVSPQPGC